MSNLQNELQSRVRDAIAIMSDGLVDRDSIVEVVLLTALAGEHSVLLGPPGVAKSELARRLAWVIDLATPSKETPSGGHSSSPGYVEFLLTSFTKPDEILGPLDINELKRSRYSRQTELYLPGTNGEPRIAFLDEIFKANSAILNALLTLLNEGHYDNGATRVTPSWFSVVAASNELPGGASDDDESAREAQVLGALYDRFLTRVWVTPFENDEDVIDYFHAISRNTRAQRPKAPLQIADIATARIAAINDVVLPAAVQLYLLELRKRWNKTHESYVAGQLAATEQAKTARRRVPPFVSDRRWGKIINLMKVAAWYDGRDYVSIRDTFVLPYVLPTIREDALHLLSSDKSDMSQSYCNWSVLSADSLGSQVFSQSPLSRSEIQASLLVTRDILKLLEDGGISEDATAYNANLWSAIASETLDDAPWASKSNTQVSSVKAFETSCQSTLDAIKADTLTPRQRKGELSVSSGDETLSIPFIELQPCAETLDWPVQPISTDRAVFLAAASTSEAFWNAVMAQSSTRPSNIPRRKFTDRDITSFLNELHDKATFCIDGTRTPVRKGAIIVPTYSMWQHAFLTGDGDTLTGVLNSIEAALTSNNAPIATLAKDQRKFEREYAKAFDRQLSLAVAPEFHMLLGDQQVLRIDANGQYCSAGLNTASLTKFEKARWNAPFNALRLAIELDLT